MTILLSLMQSEKQVRLERLSRVFPCLITAESRRRKLQRFLDLPNLTIELIWFPLITYWLTWGSDKEVYEIDCIRVAARIPC
jgi:hypothetical protein